ncbi:MAG: DUF2150 family protein [Methanomicrobiales archaeon]|mgnify:CR=1 FL=1|nr:DUF2150 family protein [Methanomicrobiales archaeon]MDI6877446.1 DUF2150 family protein [Methanomicrobiales archaeon]
MAKKRSKEEEQPQKLFYIFYSQERWNNWINTLRGMNFEPEGDEMPEGYQALYNFTEDITISTLKIVRLYQNGRFTREEALEKLGQVEAIVMSDLPEDRIGEIVESLQLSLLVLFASCRKYLEGGFDKSAIKTHVKEGRALADTDLEGALALAADIGASVIDGASCCEKYLKDDMKDSTLFDEWLIEIETMRDEMKSLKNFDEEPGEVT